MELRNQLKLISESILKTKENVLTEEAAKMAFVAPFINLLGYNVFNPYDVVPEFVADLGIKTGEKIDYALLKDGNPIILVECKWHGHTLDPYNSQLFRYFHVTKAKFGILTNGIEYRIYTDLLEPNKMDEKPFFIFNITDLRDNEIEEIRKFHKDHFNADSISNAATELKFSNEIRNILANEMNSSSEDFVRHFATRVYPGRITGKVLEQFKQIVSKTFAQYINDQVTDRIKQALKKEQEMQKPEETTVIASKIETTTEELECFFIIRAILAEILDVNRVSFRDAQSYFSIILDGSTRKTICRLYLNGSKKYLVTFDQKQEMRTEILSPADLYKHSEKLKKSLSQQIGYTENSTN